MAVEDLELLEFECNFVVTMNFDGWELQAAGSSIRTYGNTLLESLRIPILKPVVVKPRCDGRFGTGGILM